MNSASKNLAASSHLSATMSTLSAPLKPPRVHEYIRPQPPKFQTLEEESTYRKQRLVMACRVMVEKGFEWRNTHLSSRDALRTDTFWTLPAGLSLSGATVESLIQIDLRGTVVAEGSRGANYDIQSTAVHIAAYSGRKDVEAIIHSNGVHMRAFSMHRKPLAMCCQDSCTFYQSSSLLPMKAFLGAQEDPILLQRTLDDGKALIIENGGGLVVSQSIEGCVGLILRLEGVCEVQLLAEAAIKGRGGTLQVIGDEEAMFTAKSISTPIHAWLMARPYFLRQQA